MRPLGYLSCGFAAYLASRRINRRICVIGALVVDRWKIIGLAGRGVASPIAVKYRAVAAFPVTLSGV